MAKLAYAKYPKFYRIRGKEPRLRKGVKKQLAKQQFNPDELAKHQMHEGATPHGGSPLSTIVALSDGIAFMQGIIDARRGGFKFYRSETDTAGPGNGVSTTLKGTKWEKWFRGERARREVPSWSAARNARKAIVQMRHQLMELAIKYKIPPQQIVAEYNKLLVHGGRSRQVAVTKRGPWYTLFRKEHGSVDKPWDEFDIFGIRFPRDKTNKEMQEEHLKQMERELRESEERKNAELAYMKEQQEREAAHYRKKAA